MSIDRNYTVIGEVSVQAPDPATAQAAIQAAQRAIDSALAGLATPVSLVLWSQDVASPASDPDGRPCW